MPIDIQLILSVVQSLFSTPDAFLEYGLNHLKEKEPSTFAKVQAFTGTFNGERVIKSLEKMSQKYENLIYCEQEIKAQSCQLEQLGFSKEDFEAFKSAIIKAIELTLPEKWDVNLKDEWQLFLGFVLETMTDKTNVFGGTLHLNNNDHLNSSSTSVEKSLNEASEDLLDEKAHQPLSMAEQINDIESQVSYQATLHSTEMSPPMAEDLKVTVEREEGPSISHEVVSTIESTSNDLQPDIVAVAAEEKPTPSQALPEDIKNLVDLALVEHGFELPNALQNQIKKYLESKIQGVIKSQIEQMVKSLLEQELCPRQSNSTDAKIAS